MIEALITLAIIGVLASLAIPSFNNARDRYRLRAVSEALYADLQYARSVAIKSNSTVHLSLVTSNCWGMNISTACDCSTANSCQLKQSNITLFPWVSMEPSVTATSIDGTRGLATGGALSVTFTSRLGKQAQVNLTALGRATLCSPASSIPDYPAC